MKKLPYYFYKSFAKGYIYTLQRRWDLQFSVIFMFVEGEIWGVLPQLWDFNSWFLVFKYRETKHCNSTVTGIYMIFISCSISVYRLKIVNCNHIDPKLPIQLYRYYYLLNYIWTTYIFQDLNILNTSNLTILKITLLFLIIFYFLSSSFLSPSLSIQTLEEWELSFLSGL